MDKTITVLTPSDILSGWNSYSQLLEQALKYNNGTHTLSGILADLLQDKTKLIVCKDTEVNAVCIIEFIYYPSKKVCNISFLASTDVEVYKEDFLSFVFRYAKEYGCNTVEAYGRKGWKRFLKNFEFNEIYTVLERKL